jgi:5-methylcytosine-specific restriction endonuclease McrA
MALTSGIPSNKKEKVYLQQKGCCFDCRKYLTGKWIKKHTLLNWKGKKALSFRIYDGEIHHVIERQHGGKSCIENLVLLCTPCHSRRHRGK